MQREVQRKQYGLRHLVWAYFSSGSLLSLGRKLHYRITYRKVDIAVILFLEYCYGLHVSLMPQEA